jgi:hypothetical protein
MFPKQTTPYSEQGRGAEMCALGDDLTNSLVANWAGLGSAAAQRLRSLGALGSLG